MILCRLSGQGAHTRVDLLSAAQVFYDRTRAPAVGFSAVSLNDPGNRLERVGADAVLAWLVEEGIAEEWALRAVQSARSGRLVYKP
ncbi:hypothetical protein GCM10027570_32150 [Streptomonospora sediminis]